MPANRIFPCGGLALFLLLLAGCQVHSPGGLEPARLQAPEEKRAGPQPVVYVPASAEDNLRAHRQVQEDLSPQAPLGRSAELFASPLSCGPALWAVVRDHPGLRSIERDVRHVVPLYDAGGKLLGMEEREAMVFLGRDEVRSFLLALRERVVLAPPAVLRPLSEEEVTAYWATIAFPIEEPVFVLETTAGERLVLDLHPVDGGGFAVHNIDLLDAEATARPSGVRL